MLLNKQLFNKYELRDVREMDICDTLSPKKKKINK